MELLQLATHFFQSLALLANLLGEACKDATTLFVEFPHLFQQPNHCTGRHSIVGCRPTVGGQTAIGGIEAGASRTALFIEICREVLGKHQVQQLPKVLKRGAIFINPQEDLHALPSLLIFVLSS